jgi:hypothetical protein
MFLPYKALSNYIIYRCKYIVKCVKFGVIQRKVGVVVTRIAMQEMSLNTHSFPSIRSLVHGVKYSHICF